MIRAVKTKTTRASEYITWRKAIASCYNGKQTWLLQEALGRN
jgi:hypothetical protein